ncbi:MAG: transcriptional regulator [Burkholderiaceae bacterium]|nr:transcriptional regulator [Burkholderiaceae bacterium]
MKAILIGILSAEKIRERILGMAAGKVQRLANEPKIWFTSIQSLADTLDDERRAMRREVLQAMKPTSFSALAELVGREPADLPMAIQSIQKGYGIVPMKCVESEIQLVALTTEFDLAAQEIA